MLCVMIYCLSNLFFFCSSASLIGIIVVNITITVRFLGRDSDNILCSVYNCFFLVLFLHFFIFLLLLLLLFQFHFLVGIMFYIPFLFWCSLFLEPSTLYSIFLFPIFCFSFPFSFLSSSFLSIVNIFLHLSLILLVLLCIFLFIFISNLQLYILAPFFHLPFLPFFLSFFYSLNRQHLFFICTVRAFHLFCPCFLFSFFNQNST